MTLLIRPNFSLLRKQGGILKDKNMTETLSQFIFLLMPFTDLNFKFISGSLCSI